MKIIAFAATNSRNSINKKLVTFAANRLAAKTGGEVEVLDLNDFEMPIYSVDREAEGGIPEPAKAFFEKIGEADKVLVSFGEFNGSYSVAYKNVFDWASRIDQKVYQGKSTVVLATSPGPGGAQSVLAAAVNSAPYFAMEVKGSMSLPSFFENFDTEKAELTNEVMLEQLDAVLDHISA